MGVGGYVRISMLNMRFWLVVSSGIMHFMGGCYKRWFVRVVPILVRDRRVSLLVVFDM